MWYDNVHIAKLKHSSSSSNWTKGGFFCVQDAQQACILLYKPAGKEAKIVVLMTAEVKRPKESQP